MTGATGPTGSIGAQGVTGATGPAGVNGTGVWYQNAGVTLGLFNTVNIIGGGLIAATGPNNTVTINSLPDFIQMGLTGANAANAGYASGAMLQWNWNYIAPTGNLGHTTIGTQCGWLTVQKSAYYQISYSLNFTGIPAAQIMAQQFVSATGGSNQYGYGSGSAINQSIGIGFGATCYIDQTYMVYLPSGCSVETYLLKTGVSASGFGLSPTGSAFLMRSIG